MAYRLTARPLARDVRRLVRKELDAAIARLAADEPGDIAVHEARKSIKKVRAIMKLLRKPLGNRFKRENGRLRDAGRRLGTLRDADVAGETLAGLRSTVLTKPLERQVSHGLARHRRTVRQHASALTSQALGLVRKARKTLTDRISQAAGSRALQRGLVATYQKSRSVLADLTRLSGDSEFHLWRRRVKDHWYHVRLFEAIDSGSRRRAQSLKRLEADLGDDHNLARLSELLLERPASFGGAVPTTIAQGCIHERQHKLRDRALVEGRRLFAAKPKDFADSVARWWLEKKRRR